MVKYGTIQKRKYFTKDRGVVMGEKTYSMKEVTGMLDIESYVLRYYEKELKLDIHRNSQVGGHP